MSGKKSTDNVLFKKERLKEALAMNGCTIKRLGQTDEIEWSERSLTRFIKEGYMPSDALEQVARFLNVEPEYIVGKYDPSDSLPEDVKASLKRFIKPERFPYVKKEIRDVSVDQYYSTMLNIHNVSMEQFITLEPEKRFEFQHRVEEALEFILKDYFKPEIQDETRFEAQPFDLQISTVEEDYRMYGIDYWTEPEYSKKIKEKEAEMLSKWDID